jgi:hypothetical protein
MYFRKQNEYPGTWPDSDRFTKHLLASQSIAVYFRYSYHLGSVCKHTYSVRLLSRYVTGPGSSVD